MRLLVAFCVIAVTGTASAAPVRSKEAGGEHIRIETRNGPVHVFMPPGYRAETAGIALYVHGYYTDVDKAWKEHKLAEQFARSRRNALFIAPEAPDGMKQPVFWPDLHDLLVEVRRKTGLARPWGPVVAMVHSGGYRTAVEWLKQDVLDQLILLDAMYGEEEAFRAWLEEDRHRRRQLLVVGADTLRWTEAFARDANAAGLATVEREVYAGTLSEVESGASVVYMRSGLGHMQLVERGGVIPVLFIFSRLPVVSARGAGSSR
jgi:hypothetical protein